MHCSANEGKDGDVSIFFGLSGTGKTTLSADPKPLLIGDDEHVLDRRRRVQHRGRLLREGRSTSRRAGAGDLQCDPLRLGARERRVRQGGVTRVVDYTTSRSPRTRAAATRSSTSRTRRSPASRPPEQRHLPHRDAFGVLPPVSKLTPEQAMYHFISGYTAKVAGTEMGVKEPEATFSACFGARSWCGTRPSTPSCSRTRA
jgi:phosphoenolpyruvate carboxykinase (ATP)